MRQLPIGVPDNGCAISATTDYDPIRTAHGETSDGAFVTPQMDHFTGVSDGLDSMAITVKKP